jgi:hypothetical protein
LRFLGGEEGLSEADGTVDGCGSDFTGVASWEAAEVLSLDAAAVMVAFDLFVVVEFEFRFGLGII